MGRLILHVERAIDEHRNRRGARVGLEVGQGVVQSPAVLEQVVADQDQLDVGRLGRGAEALVAGQLELGIIAQVDEEAGELAPSVGVAIDDHGPGKLPG